MKRISKFIFPSVVILGLLSCDESGQFEYEHLGKWQKDGDSLVSRTSRDYYPMDEDTDGRFTLEFFEDLSYESITIDRFGDTTHQYVGEWSLSLHALTINYEVGYPSVYDLSMEEDVLKLSYNNWSSKYIQIFQKLD